MQNEAMVSRLVLRPGADTPPVRIEPSSSEASTGPSLHLGSQDLIRVAGFAIDHGFRVARFRIADAYLTPLDDDEQREISAELVTILDDFDEDELESALSDDYDGLYIIGVELVSRGTGLRIGLRRSGFVSVSDAELHAAEVLISDAWRELRLA